MAHNPPVSYNHLAYKAFAPYKKVHRGKEVNSMQKSLKKLCLVLVLILAVLAAGILVPAKRADMGNQDLPAVAFFLGDLIEGT